MTEQNWLILQLTLPQDIELSALAGFVITQVENTPTFSARSWTVNKAGRGNAFCGNGPPTLADLHVTELRHGAMIAGRNSSFISLLNNERTRRLDRNWARVYPALTSGIVLQVSLKGLDDTTLELAHRQAVAVAAAAQANFAATDALLQWRRDGNNQQLKLDGDASGAR